MFFFFPPSPALWRTHLFSCFYSHPAVLNSPNGFPFVTLTLFWRSTSYPKLNLTFLSSQTLFYERLACSHTHFSTSYSDLQMTILVYSHLVFHSYLKHRSCRNTEKKIKNVRGWGIWNNSEVWIFINASPLTNGHFPCWMYEEKNKSIQNPWPRLQFQFQHTMTVTSCVAIKLSSLINIFFALNYI